jgi:hypothetical protein
MAETVVNEERLKSFIGTKVAPSIYRVKGKKMAEFAECIGDTNPKYVGVDGDLSNIVAHPSFPSSFSVKALFNLADVGDAVGPLITNIGKLLHTGQVYDYTGCAPIVPSIDKLYTHAEITNIFIKSSILWVEVTMKTTDSQEVGQGTLYCTTIATVGIRKGGY